MTMNHSSTMRAAVVFMLVLVSTWTSTTTTTAFVSIVPTPTTASSNNQMNKNPTCRASVSIQCTKESQKLNELIDVNEKRFDQNQHRSLAHVVSKGVMIATLVVASNIFVLFPQIPSATAIVNTVDQDIDLLTKSSLLLAKGAYIPETGYDSLDLSMPSYRVDESDSLVKSNNDIMSSISSGESSSKATATKVSSSPSRAEKGALAVAKAKAKKEAAKAEALARQQELKGKTFAN